MTRRTLRTLLRESLVFLFFVAAAVAFTWPLAMRLGTATTDLGDPLLSTWIINWDQYAAVHFPHRIYDAPIFHPASYALAFSENMFGIALASFPFYLVGFRPLEVYNLAVILGIAFAGFGGYVLGMTVTRSRFASILAGILYAFAPYRLNHLEHIQIVWSGWLPLLLATLLLYWRKPTTSRAAAFGVCVLANGLTNIHWLLFGTAAIGITMIVLALLAPRDVKVWARVLVAFGLATALLIPVLLPYRTVSRLYQMQRSEDEARWGSATLSDWLVAGGRSRTYGNLPDKEKFVHHERKLFPGLLPVFLTLAGFLLHRRQSPDQEPEEGRRIPRGVLHAIDGLIVAAAIVAYWGAVTKQFELRLADIHVISVRTSETATVVMAALILLRLSLRLPRVWWRDGTPRSLRTMLSASRLPVEWWMCLLWVVIGVAGSLGVNAFVHAFLFRYVDAFRALRVPARWAMIAYTGLAGTAALGASALVARRSGRWRHAVAAVLVVAAFIDVRPQIRWEHAVPGVDPVYRWLRDTPVRGAIIEFPMSADAVQFQYLLGATEHRRLSMNGFSGFEPPVHAQIRELAAGVPIPPALVDVLERNGAHLVIIHEDWLPHPAEPVRQWLRSELARNRLAFIRRFDHKTAGDWVFAVARNMPEWRTLVPPLAPDAAGHLPNQALARMLDGEPTYMSRSFGFVDKPKKYEDVHGPLTVSGWAVSPNGVRTVEILLDSARHRFHADFVDRPDVAGIYPWYPRGGTVGFSATIPRRPRRVSRYTDVQVEITDGAGFRTRLPAILLDW